MTRHTDHADIMSEIFSSELCSQTETVRSLKKFLLKLYITESMTILVTFCGKVIIIFHRSFLHCRKVCLSGCSSDDKCDMIRRTCSCAESLHFLYQEWNESFLIQNSLCFLIKICFVG